MDFLMIGIIVAVLYVAGSLIYARKKGKIKVTTLEEFWVSIRETNTKQFMLALMQFTILLLVFRMIVIGQTVAQTCNVGQDQLPSETLDRYGMKPFEVDKSVMMDLGRLEEGRDYNYYRRAFNENGGRPGNVWIKCNWNVKDFWMNLNKDIREVQN